MYIKSIKSYTTKGRRSYNEDSHSIIKKSNITLCGIYDGHGGSEVSSYLKKNFGKLLLEKPSDAFHASTVRQRCKIAGEQLDKYLDTQKITSGSTAIVTMVKNNDIIILNIGDCRGIICRGGLALPLTKDHKPGNIEEKERIQKMGGTLKFDPHIDSHRIQGMSVSRSFGDSDIKYISNKPDISRSSLKPEDSFILLASDGLWDSLDNQQVAEFVMQNKNKKDLLEKLAAFAITKGSNDNITIILMNLKQQVSAGKTSKTVSNIKSKTKSKIKSKTKSNKKS